MFGRVAAIAAVVAARGRRGDRDGGHGRRTAATSSDGGGRSRAIKTGVSRRREVANTVPSASSAWTAK